jgi:hypothetical protein
MDRKAGLCATIVVVCKVRLSSRHDSGPKSGIVFDESHTKAPLRQRFAVGLLDQNPLRASLLPRALLLSDSR